ncbi:MAG: cytochrome oxidase [Planctomycetota bacterium]|nr:MAG: cytochrome oxidase [Planctomycetota bacterium]
MEAERDRKLVCYGLVKAHIAAAAVFLMYGLLAGFLYSLQFLNRYPFEGIEWLSPARVRMTHTNGIAYGFLVNGFVGCLYYAVPRLTGRRVLSEKLGWFLCWALQFTVLTSALGILLGHGQAVEWGETPTGFEPGSLQPSWIPDDLLVAVFAVGLALQLGTPLVQAREKRLYVAAWYISASLIWTILTYVMGNVVPEWFLPGTSGAAVVGLYIHDLVGLSVTPWGWGLMYFFVPLILKKPIWSHSLSIIGFWALAFFYPLNGVHHFLLSPIPMYVQYGAILSTIAIEVVVTTVVVNFFGTLRGSTGAIKTNLPVRWFYTGMVLYLLTCLQCAFQTTVTFQKVIHFTDWVVGHAHLVMFGVFTFWLLGVFTWLWPRVTGREWHSQKLHYWTYWLTTIGVVAMFFDLVIAGLIHGFMQADLNPWMDIVRSSHSFWWVRTFTGGMIVAGVALFFYNMWMTARSSGPAYDEGRHQVDAGGVPLQASHG